MAGSTISSTITSQVTLGYGVTLSPLTITNRGEINVSGGYAILIGTAYDGTIVNNGSIIGRTDGVYAAGYAVTIFNQGTVFGQQAGIQLENLVGGPDLVVNASAILGSTGILGSDASITNTGVIDGVGFGVRVSSSELTNSGTIAAQTGVDLQQSTLANSGAIIGSQLGLYLGGGNAVNSGSIAGGVQIANDSGNGSLINHGTISGGVTVAGGTLVNTAQVAGNTGVLLGIGGNATNSGQIYGQSYGVVVSGPANASNESLNNSGSIYSPNEGVTLSGAYVRNSGSIGGGNIGVTLSGGLAVNYGLISSQSLAVAMSAGSFGNSGTVIGQTDGILLAGGVVTNFETISGGVDGVALIGGTLGNYGRIFGATYGVEESGGSVANYGLISSSSFGVVVSHAMLTNAGTIAGGRDAVYGSFITLSVDPGAVFAGNVVNNNDRGVLNLAGAGLGTLSGIGSQIEGFDTISFESGNWVIAGDVAGLASGAPITGMTRADTIILNGFTAASHSYVNGTGLEMSDGSTTVTLNITGSFTSAGFRVTDIGAGTEITDVTCYAAGTRIAVPGGDVAVEQLKIGDPVRTLQGDRPVKWVGWRHYDGRSIKGNRAALPVCIRRNAIADGVPARDLYVSPGHAIAIDDVLIHASRLVNGVSVVQSREVESITYYHVEFEGHEIIFAENCAAESFQDEYFREQFVNAAAYHQLYPGDKAPAESCLPRLTGGFQLQAIKGRLAARAGIEAVGVIGALRGYVDQCDGGLCFGWAQDVVAPEEPVSLDILCGGRLIGRVLADLYRRDVRDAGYGNGYQGFELVLPALGGLEVEVRRTIDGARLELADNTIRRAA